VADIQGVLRLLEQFESLMNEIYNEFCEAFSGDAEASALFSRLAFEERSHLGQVQFLRRLARQNSVHFADVELDLEALKREVAQLENIRRAAPHLSLHEALVIAMEFEKGVAEVHSREAVAKANPDVSRVLGSLQAGDQRHFDALLAFARGRGLKST
jgi:rubrerythrin